MGLGSLTGPAVVAAIVSGIISTVVMFVNRATTVRLHRERISADQNLAERKFDLDKDLAERRFNYDNELAERKLQYERELHDHKRRVELAETILAEFLQVAAVIQAVRFSGAFGGEAAGRPRSEGETDEQARQLDLYYVPAARLTKQADLISSLMSKRYRACAVLGAQIDQAFEQLTNIINRIKTSSQALMYWITQPEGLQRRNAENIERFEEDIWGGLPETDRLQPILNSAIEIVENICRPILGGDRAA